MVCSKSNRIGSNWTKVFYSFFPLFFFLICQPALCAENLPPKDKIIEWIISKIGRVETKTTFVGGYPGIVTQKIYFNGCKLIIETIGNKLSPDAKLIWGAQIADDMEKSMRVLLIVTGVQSSQILGHGETIESLKHKEIEEELGIEFFE